MATPDDVVADGEEQAGRSNILAEYTAEIRRFHDRAENLETVNRKMHARIAQLEGDMLRSSLRPVVKLLAELHGECANSVARLRARDGAQDAEHVAADFLSFAGRIEESLEGLGIVSLDVAVGDPFDPRVHQTFNTVDTEIEADDRRVRQVFHQGFRDASSDKPIVYAKVSVWNHRPV